MNVSDIVTIDIIDYDHQGYGVGKIDNYPIFVPKAIPGERVDCKILKMTKRLAEASLVTIHNPSEKRNQNMCQYYDRCGGCSLMHLNYEEQLNFKKKNLENTLYRIGGIKAEVNDVIKNPNPLHYRNKIIVPLGYDANGKIISGFYEHKSHKIVPSDLCEIEHLGASSIINYIKECYQKYELPIYDETTHSGICRNIMLRVNSNNEFMVVLVVKKNTRQIKEIALSLTEKFSNVKSVYICLNQEKTNVVLKGSFIHVAGSKYLIETLNGLKFYVHPNSFLQINHDQAEALYEKAVSYISEDKNQTIIDAYCGIGTITLNLAKKAKEVYGIEIVSEAIDNANENKKLNGLENAHFLCGKCEEEIQKLIKLKNIDSIVFDPPRKGCDEAFLNTVIDMKIKNIIYISCLPQTLARDLRYLIDHGYSLKEVTPFDLFSQTDHVETIAYLTKNEF